MLTICSHVVVLASTKCPHAHIRHRLTASRNSYAVTSQLQDLAISTMYPHPCYASRGPFPLQCKRMTSHTPHPLLLKLCTISTTDNVHQHWGGQLCAKGGKDTAKAGTILPSSQPTPHATHHLLPGLSLPLPLQSPSGRNGLFLHPKLPPRCLCILDQSNAEKGSPAPQPTTPED